MQFTLALPGETIFRSGALDALPAIIGRYGRRIALVRGGAHYERSPLAARVSTLLSDCTLCEAASQTREPEPEDVDAAVERARACAAEVVVAIGGGSVLDLGKAVAGLAPQDAAYGVRAYLEGVGEGRTLTADPLPFIAIPTTAGTGSEATKNAVISSHREHFKKSLRDRRMLADVALIDPALTRDLPPALTAATGMDALTQLIEAYTTHKANPVTDALAEQGLSAARALLAAYRDGDDLAAREQMALAAYLSGVCLANAGLGAAHGIAAALGSVSSISHGLACAIALPRVMAANLSAARARYARIAEILTGEKYADAEAGAHAAVHHIRTLLHQLAIPRASTIPALAEALHDDHLADLASLAHGNSLRGNPRPLDDGEIIAILRAMRDDAA